METSTVDSLLDSICSIQKKTDFYSIRRQNLLENLRVLNDDIEVLKQRKQLIESAKQYYLKVIDLCYMHSIQEMEEFVNHVLAYVFYDEYYRIKLDITNKHNKSITFYLVDDSKNLELPLRKGNGKGIKAVVSFILLTYYLLRMKSNYLFLDEAFVNLSAGYVEKFFEYIKTLCDKHGLCVVLITHDSRFTNFADSIFEVKKGVVTKQL